MYGEMNNKTTRFLFVLLVLSLTPLSFLSAEESKEIYPFQLSKQRKFSLDIKTNTLFPLLIFDGKSPAYMTRSYDDYTFVIDFHFKIITAPTSEFSLANNNLHPFSLSLSPSVSLLLSRGKKKYGKTAIEIAGMNVGLWAVSKYVFKKSWANISLETILWNIDHGPDWDYDDFLTNQFMHPFHGAIHYCTARANGFNFLESSVWTLGGGLMWEFLLESLGTKNNPPSGNDLIMNTSGGALLGEALFRFSNLIIDESSVGLERVLRESLAFFINPASGFRFFSGEAFRRGIPPQNINYDLSFPFGAVISSSNEPSFIISANLEYKDFEKKNISALNPYDWFSFNVRFGIHDYSLRDKEFYTLGILTGKRIKNGFAGLFGVFDYIDTHIAEQYSAVGVGPGFVTQTMSDSNLYFRSLCVLSVIFGGSNPSIEPEEYHFGKKTNEPYYLGPGMLGKVKLELGKKGLGSIDTGFSQYWINSIFYDADEFLSLLSFNLKCNVSDKSQICFGYDYFIKRGTLHSQNFTKVKPAFRALYIWKF